MSYEMPPHLSDNFYKSRRNLFITSSFLLFWEFGGIKLGNSDSSGTINATLPGKINLTIENTEIIPIILLFSTLYFIFRVAIEWFQCHTDRINYIVSKLDISISISFSLLSICVFFIQEFLGVRLYEIVIQDALSLVIIGIFSMPLLRIFLLDHIMEVKFNKTSNLTFSVSFGLVIVICIIWGMFLPRPDEQLLNQEHFETKLFISYIIGNMIHISFKGIALLLHFSTKKSHNIYHYPNSLRQGR